MDRVGNFALALAGRTRNVHAAPLGLAGRNNLVLKPIFTMALVMRGKVSPTAFLPANDRRRLDAALAHDECPGASSIDLEHSLERQHQHAQRLT
jgi:hypothetical protein